MTQIIETPGASAYPPRPGADEVAKTEPDEPGRLKRLMNTEITPKRVKLKDLMHFSRQLGVFVRAGIPLTEALQALTEEMGSKLLKQILIEVDEAIQGGSTFAGAMAEHADAFPPYYVGILRSAEATGSLDSACDHLAAYIERDVETRRKIRSALTYPAVTMLMAIVVVCVLCFYVLPKFQTFFASLGAKLPLATRMLLAIGHFIRYRWYVIAAVLLVIFILAAWSTFSDRGRALRDRIVLRIPALGDLVRHAVLERFCRMLSSMVIAGVPLPEALTITSGAISNDVYRRGLTGVHDAMLRGEGLAGPMAASGLFPASVKQMFRVGENTGTLDTQMDSAATYFDKELDYRIKTFTNLFEPAVIIFVGVIVGFVAIALISAMYGVYRQVSV